jgi:short-subunit dehydrogenase
LNIFSCNVALLDRSRDVLENLASECSKNGIKAHVIICDMSSKQSVEESCKQIGQVFQNRVDILINNAGIFGESISAIEEKTPSGKDVVDMWEEVMMVNLVNLMRITGKCLPMMKECQHGAIITISSLAATVSIQNRKELILLKYLCYFR